MTNPDTGDAQGRGLGWTPRPPTTTSGPAGGRTPFAATPPREMEQLLE